MFPDTLNMNAGDKNQAPLNFWFFGMKLSLTGAVDRDAISHLAKTEKQSPRDTMSGFSMKELVSCTEIAASSSKPLVSQATFDKAVTDAQDEEGMTLEEACLDTIECLEEDFDLSGLFLYRNESQLTEKNAQENRLTTLEKVASCQESFVNASFCFQGLRQVLLGDEIGNWALCKSRNVIRTLVHMLPGAEEDDEVEEDDDSDSDDEDEDRQLQSIDVMEMLKFILLTGKTNFAPTIELLKTAICTEEEMQWLLRAYDKDISDSKVTSQFLELLHIMLTMGGEEAKALFSKCKGGEAVTLAAKFHKKDKTIQERVKLFCFNEAV